MNDLSLPRAATPAPDAAAAPTPAFALTVGPLLYYWPRETMLHFYAGVADSPAHTVVLGEVVCARRHELKAEDWLSLARDLRAAGKEVVLATQALVESEADLRLLRRIAANGEFLLEAGDASAIGVLEAAGTPFVLGPHVNVYSPESLREHVAMGGCRWVAPVELSLEAVGRIRAGAPRLPTEAWAWGRLPLAFSARCFTARHHHLAKDHCGYRCRDDADGLMLSSTDSRPFLVLNGIQTQSATTACLLHEREALRAAGVTRLRLSPGSRGFNAVLSHFDAVMNHGADPDAALPALPDLAGPAGLSDGFARAQPGMAWSH